jgi:hypothetical protein
MLLDTNGKILEKIGALETLFKAVNEAHDLSNLDIFSTFEIVNSNNSNLIERQRIMADLSDGIGDLKGTFSDSDTILQITDSFHKLIDLVAAQETCGSKKDTLITITNIDVKHFLELQNAIIVEVLLGAYGKNIILRNKVSLAVQKLHKSLKFKKGKFVVNAANLLTIAVCVSVCRPYFPKLKNLQQIIGDFSVKDYITIAMCERVNLYEGMLIGSVDDYLSISKDGPTIVYMLTYLRNNLIELQMDKTILSMYNRSQYTSRLKTIQSIADQLMAIFETNPPNNHFLKNLIQNGVEDSVIYKMMEAISLVSSYVNARNYGQFNNKCFRLLHSLVVTNNLDTEAFDREELVRIKKLPVLNIKIYSGYNTVSK